MPDIKKNAELMLFDYGTTNRTDYHDAELKAYPKTVYKAKPRCIVIRPKGLKDGHTLSEWKTEGIPFDLLHTCKEIVRTNPWIVQKRYEKPIDVEREHVQKTRPRLVMTPAVSMDDIEDPRAREILCSDMYTSDMTRGMKQAVKPYFRICAPFPGLPAPANPIKLPKLQPPVVPAEWRMDSVSWDNRQLRAYCDPTKEFWMARKLSKCKACEESAIADANRKMIHQLKSGL